MVEPAEFIDLLPDWLAAVAKNTELSAHQIARNFVIDQGRVRGGVEVIAVTDAQGRLIGVGTQDLPAAVDFPPAVNERLQDPAASLVVHHNHPPCEEPFFSDTDMRGLAGNRGIGWLLMHNEAGYTAMRAADRMFMPDMSDHLPADGLPSAYKAGIRIAQLGLFREGVDINQPSFEGTAPALALQALKQVGAIQYYSSFKTGLSHELEQAIIQRIRSECISQPELAGGKAVWGGTEGAALPAASGGEPGADRHAALPDPPAVQTEFHRFVDVLSGQDHSSHDRAAAGRSVPSTFSEAGGGSAGLESASFTGRALLEKGLKSACAHKI